MKYHKEYVAMIKESIMYTIGQVAKFLGVSRDTLKFYEEKELVKPKQNIENGYSKYYLYKKAYTFIFNWYRILIHFNWIYDLCILKSFYNSSYWFLHSFFCYGFCEYRFLYILSKQYTCRYNGKGWEHL
ncbi:hypothetical protein EMIT079MI2_40134 [Bacillus sp. IT-79MI2]